MGIPAISFLFFSGKCNIFRVTLCYTPCGFDILQNLCQFFLRVSSTAILHGHFDILVPDQPADFVRVHPVVEQHGNIGAAYVMAAFGKGEVQVVRVAVFLKVAVEYPLVA